jgi:hypothetical protein
VGLISEVTVTLGKHTTAATVLAAAIFLLPGLAQAQRQATGRQAVPRAVPARPIHNGGVYRGPVVHRAYYASPYWYGGYYPYYGYGYPWAFSVGFGCCGYPYYGYPYYGYGYPYGYAYDVSSLRLQVQPREAEVFIDGYYAGTVDDFDGTFQRLRVEPGDHELEVFLPGHRAYQQKVYLQPGKTFNVRHEMAPLGPGEAEPVRPVGKPRPTAPSSRSQRYAPNGPRDRDPNAAGEEQGPGPDRGQRSEFGSLALRVQPSDASITIDGEPWQNSGDTERFVLQLGPGVHNVQIRKDGYRTYMTDITVRPGETTTLNVAMTPNR